jgi:hypothetical protein
MFTWRRERSLSWSIATCVPHLGTRIPIRRQVLVPEIEPLNDFILEGFGESFAERGVEAEVSGYLVRHPMFMCPPCMPHQNARHRKQGRG